MCYQTAIDLQQKVPRRDSVICSELQYPALFTRAVTPAFY